MQTSLLVAFSAVLMMLATSINAESICSIHGQSHIVMTDGRAKFSYRGEGLYQVFSAIVDEHAVDVQCEFKRSSPAIDLTQLGECRILVTSQTCKADVRFVDGQVSVWGQQIPMKSIDEFSAKSLDKSLGLAIHALASNSVGLELSFGQQFISISLAPLSLTIASASLAKCDGLCGSCSGPQTAPELDLVAAYAAAFKIDAGHEIVPQKPCSSLPPSFQVLQSDDTWPLPAFNAPNVSQSVPVFQSAAVRDAVVQQCSDGDLARIAADPLFGSFVEDCIADKSAGPMGTETAKSAMDAFVTLIENRQKVAVAEQSLKESPNATVCAACMTVEWEKPINTTGILEPTVTMRPEEIAPGTGAEYPLAYSPAAATSAGQNEAFTSRKSDLYASAAPLYKPPTNLYTATPAPIHNLYATKTNAPALKTPETPFPTVASPAPSTAAKTAQATPFPTVASPAPSTAGKSAEPTLRPTTNPVVASPAPTTAASTNAPSTQPNVTSPAPTTAAKSMMPTVTSPAPTAGAKGYDPVLSMTTVPTTAPSGASAAPVNQTRAPANSTSAPQTTSPSGATGAPSTQTPQPSNGTSPTTAPTGSSAAPTNQTRSPTDAPGSSAAPTNQTRAPSNAPVNQANTTTAPLTTSPSGASAAPVTQTTAPLNGSSVAPASTAPATSAPSNGSAPITAAPTTAAPATAAPITAAPATTAPTTAAPTTAAPTTVAPTTAAPTTPAATTAAPTTAAPTTVMPTANALTAVPVVAATMAPNSTSAPSTTAPATTTASVAPATVAPASTTAPKANATAAPLTTMPANANSTSSTPVPTSGSATTAPINQTMGSSAAPTNQTRAPATSTFAPTTVVLTQVPVNQTAAPATPVPTTTSPTNKPINLPPVYNCNCTISSKSLETNRDLVTYAKQSKLIPSLQKAIRDGRNPELLAIMACGGAPDLATILDMEPTTTVELCKVCTKSKTQPALSYQSRRQSPIPSPIGQQSARVIPQTTARRDYNVVPRPVITPNRAPNTNVAKSISYVSRRRSSIAAL